MKLNKFFFGIAGLAMLFASCENDDLELGNSSTTPNDPNCPSVEFSTANATSFEVDPSDPTLTLTVVRKATEAASYPIQVVENQDDSYEVPAAVEFAAGEQSKDIKLAIKSSAAQGTPLALTLTFDEANINPYTKGLKVMNINTTVIKWESIGRGYWLGNIVNTFFGVNSLPLAVDIEKATTASAIKFRFASPYTIANEGGANDGMGYLGYPYNAAADIDGNKENIIISVTSKGAQMAPVMMGMDWGYGSFSMGSIYGYLSTNISSYPLGVYNASETGGKITFAANSLFVSMADYKDGGKYPCSAGPSVLYLSAADFMADAEE